MCGAQGAVGPPERWFSGDLAKDRLTQSWQGPYSALEEFTYISKRQERTYSYHFFKVHTLGKGERTLLPSCVTVGTKLLVLNLSLLHVSAPAASETGASRVVFFTAFRM